MNLTINEGEVLGLVGESGSGKSTIAYTFMGMYRQTDGEITFGNDVITPKTKSRSKDFRRKAQIVFQDPGSSLNPYQDVRSILSLPLKVHNVVPKRQMEEKIQKILNMVELPPDFMYKIPSAIGGGERQLVSIARARCAAIQSSSYSTNRLHSLDVSIQAKIINMLMKLKREQGLTYLFITHDLGVMRNVSNRVAIMYLGKICEIAPTELFYAKPMHPYTQMLLSAIPVISEEEDKLKPQRVECVGEVPSPVNIPAGCSFNTRCQYKCERCMKEDPVMHELSPEHYVRCHLYDK